MLQKSTICILPSKTEGIRSGKKTPPFKGLLGLVFLISVCTGVGGEIGVMGFGWRGGGHWLRSTFAYSGNSTLALKIVHIKIIIH